MRRSCLGRASLFALLLLVLVLSAMRGVAGSWDATPVGAVDWRVFAAGVSDAARALVGTAADFGGRLVGTIWAGLTAVPWLRAGAAAAGFVGDVLAGFLALLRDLGAALVAVVAGIGRTVATEQRPSGSGCSTAGWRSPPARPASPLIGVASPSSRGAGPSSSSCSLGSSSA
jgi:hypothetical protein